MPVPQQVRQRSADIDRMIKGEAQQEQPAGDPAENREAAEQTAQFEPYVEGEQPQGESSGEPEQPRVDSVDKLAKDMQALNEKLEKAERRYETLQGMHRRSEQERERLHALLAQMSEAAAAQPAKRDEQSAAQSAPNPDEARDRQDFGDDFVDFVNRAIDRKLAKIDQRLGETEGIARKSHADAEEVKQERFEAKLDKQVPGWREIDKDAAFMEWLNSSPTRVAIVRQAMADYDATAIAEVFEQYTMLQGTGQQEQPNQAPPAEPASKKLEGKVAPSTGRTSKEATTEQQPRQWTRSEIAEVFTNRRSYTRKEFDKLQAEIFAAQKQGRVDYSR